MHNLWAVTILATFIGLTTAVPCKDIAWATARDMAQTGRVDAKYPDPFDPQGRWEVYKAEECFIRFQTPGDRGHDKAFASARVTKTEHTATPGKVSNTINNFSGQPGQNEPLWLRMNIEAFQYAGILKRLGEDYLSITPQRDLNKENTVLSIILPTGMKKLDLIGPDVCNENTKRALGSGLKGTIDASDYAYGTVAEARHGLWAAKQFKSQYKADWNPAGSYMLAEKADPNECVVIDFRSIGFLEGRITI